MFRNRYQALSSSERLAFWIALLFGIGFAIFSSILIETLLNAPNLQYRVANLVPFALSLLAFTSSILILTGRVKLAAWFIQLGAFLILGFSVTQAAGYGFASAAIFIAISLYIPVNALKGRDSSNALWIGIAGTITIIIIDTFWTGFRVPILARNVLSANIITLVLALILTSTTIIQFNSYTIRTKLLILSLGVGLISILSIAIFTTFSISQTLTRQTHNALVSASEQSMEEIDTYITYNINTITAEAQTPEIVGFLQLSYGEQRNNREEISSHLNSLIQRDPDHIISFTLLSYRNGYVVADTDPFNVGFAEADRDYFAIPRNTGKAYVSPVSYAPQSTDQQFNIGVPVVDSNGKFLGVLNGRFRSIILNEIIASNNNLAGEGSYGILLDEYNLILAHGTNPDWVSHTIEKPTADTIATLQKENRILRDIGGKNISLDMPDFSGKLQALSTNVPYFSSTDKAWGTSVEVGVTKSSTTQLKLAYVQPQSVALATINQQQQITVAVAIITGMLLLIIVFLVARTITSPIANLSKVAEDIASGNISARAQYEINDELGTLANAFNRMTSQLQDTLGGLERRVAERTADLDTARLLSERRAQELQAINEISRTISTEQRLDVLLTLITRLVSERFDFYHVGIFFVDDARRYAYLQAANSEGGQRMLARGHRLEIGTGLVGTVAQTGKPRIALDVGSDTSFFNNPDLPGTHSEMVLPLNARGTTIGALDVQSVKPGAFTETDANTLGILADQIAIAIENARLFSQTQQAREEAEALYSQILSKEWSAFTHQEEKIGYQKTATGGGYVVQPIETDEIRTALENGQVVVIEGTEDKTQSSIAVPVKLQGITIGVLNIKAPTKNRKWNKEEINLVQAVSDRLALALDNIRLLQESQRRAAKEAKIGEVSAKIGASINMRNVLQTAVEELGRALPGSEVVIQFQTEQEKQ
ncbi:MAG: GAF domain-containing protein [Anaerolineales bacterium]|nr:GAF domain-containing protein [Anaerolineales bacterium]